jgi:Domain of unknown function (DUF6265)
VNPTIAIIGLHLALIAGQALAGTPDRAVTTSSFTWLSGQWVCDVGAQHTEETWSAPAVDMLIGMSRTVQSGTTTSFEFLRIVAREDGIFYIAQPRGRPPVEFRLQSFDGTQAIFVNLGHADHLQRILYKRNPDGSMSARIEGTNEGKSFFEDYAYHRAPGSP